jgi:hypothetical protein
MEAERRALRLRLAEYITTYYAEIRRQLPNYAPSDPEQIPHFLRGHKRMIRITECADGYIISYRSDPYNRRNIPLPETFEFYTVWQNRTVEDVARNEGGITDVGFPAYSDFSYRRFPHVREDESGTYADYVNPEHQEGIEYISNNKVAQLTPQAAREAAENDIREFFERNPEVSP